MNIRTSLIDLKNFDAPLARDFESVAVALEAGAFQDQESDSLLCLDRISSIVVV
jgi:hypothetical protein